MNIGSTVNRNRLWSTRDSSWFPVEVFTQDAALLNDGTLVAVLEVVPLDMALMAWEEAEAVLGRFWQDIKAPLGSAGKQGHLSGSLGTSVSSATAWLWQM